MAAVERVLLIGLHGADPMLLLDRWLDELPNLRRLAERGYFGRLESCIPPTVVPAWSCLATGKDPGALQVYGPWNRRDWTYEELAQATNLEVRQPRIWNHLARAGLDSLLVSVPQTFPIVRAPRGCLVTGLLTPGVLSPHAHPPELADELADVFGTYQFDVVVEQWAEPAELVRQARAMDEQRFGVARHLATSRPWSFLFVVATGLEVVQRRLWHTLDAQHLHHMPAHPLADDIRKYYVFLDDRIGTLLDDVDLDMTAVWVVSTSGGQSREGTVYLNDWLRRVGLLTLKRPLTAVRHLAWSDIDWARTKAWAAGGACGQVFVNRAGREPHGTVGDDEYEPLCEMIAARLGELEDHTGRPLATMVYRPADIYMTAEGTPPDLVAVFGKYRWSCEASVGHDVDCAPPAESGVEQGTVTGWGVSVLSHASLACKPCDVSVYDVAPTVLHLLGISEGHGMRGRSVV